MIFSLINKKKKRKEIMSLVLLRKTIFLNKINGLNKENFLTNLNKNILLKICKYQ